MGLIPGSGRSAGIESGNPLHYSYLENSMDRGGWQATVHRMAKSQTQLKLLAHTAHKTVGRNKLQMGFPGGSVVKNLPPNVVDVGSIPRSGRSPGEGNGNPLRYSCLGNPMDREPGGL